MNYRYVGLLTAGHLVTDINQGALPAILPFLIAEHQLSYGAAAGLVFALSMTSSVAQPLFGLYSDRLSKPWLIPIGIFLAGAGLAMIGLTSNYWLSFTTAALSGIGIAAFHPEGARLTTLVSGEKKATAISIFGIGGTVGIALGPVFMITCLLQLGLKGTLVLVIPGALLAILMIGQLPALSSLSTHPDQRTAMTVSLPDEWHPFLRLTGAVVCRSIIFFALNTFIPLYWIDVLGQSKASGGTALTILLSAGVVGQFLGGRLADEYGHRHVIKASFGTLILFLFLFATGPRVTLSTLLLIPIGMAISAPYSAMVVIGQRYLPCRVALSSGITLGLTVSTGGMIVPLLGRLADSYGLGSILWVIAGVPVLATLIAFGLPLPQIDKGCKAPVIQPRKP
jgi:FSR family fosmidomycin resistance protein-like MFS transporter